MYIHATNHHLRPPSKHSHHQTADSWDQSGDIRYCMIWSLLAAFRQLMIMVFWVYTEPVVPLADQFIGGCCVPCVRWQFATGSLAGDYLGLIGNNWDTPGAGL